jgi:hypothetical protein
VLGEQVPEHAGEALGDLLVRVRRQALHDDEGGLLPALRVEELDPQVRARDRVVDRGVVRVGAERGDERPPCGELLGGADGGQEGGVRERHGGSVPPIADPSRASSTGRGARRPERRLWVPRRRRRPTSRSWRSARGAPAVVQGS